MKKLAFTLAEVLIVLGIIGIIADMTIPTLTESTRKQTSVASLKKAYTTFNQALTKIAADNGCIGDLKCSPLMNDTPVLKDMGDEIVKNFRVIKNCAMTTTGCFSSEVGANYTDTGTKTNMDDTASFRFITADGVAYRLVKNNGECHGELSTIPPASAKYMKEVSCGELFIDVNGPEKGPNNLGRDIFDFYITNGKGPLLYPLGGDDDYLNLPWVSPTGNPKACAPINSDGKRCAARIMEEGWVMKY